MALWGGRFLVPDLVFRLEGSVSAGPPVAMDSESSRIALLLAAGHKGARAYTRLFEEQQAEQRPKRVKADRFKRVC